MQGDDRPLELPAEVLRQQDRTWGKRQRLADELRQVKEAVQGVKQKVQKTKAQPDAVLENQQDPQQVLRMMATSQPKSQRELKNSVDILDSVARMQRHLSRRTTTWKILVTSPAKST